MAESTAVVESNPVGRPSKAEKHKGQIAKAESLISDKLPALIDNAMDMALGTQPESCRFHHDVFECTNKNCHEKSKGTVADSQMIKYLVNRVMGNPGQSIDRMINMEFVDKVVKHITLTFHEANAAETEQERANLFALGIVQLWTFVGRGDD